MQKIARLLKGEDAVTALEYGLICALIALAIIIGVRSVGLNIEACMNTISSWLIVANS
jgi:pilus assembly protein Flp/PilA